MQTPGEEQQAPGEPASPADAEPTSAPSEVQAPRARAGLWLSGCALALALAALGMSGYLGYVYYGQRVLFGSDVLASIERLQRQDGKLEERNAALEQALATAQARIKTVGEVQDTLRAGLDRVLDELGRGRVEWRLAEAEQLLLIANYRLQLAHDIETAIAALRAADRQLQELGDPALLPVRRLIAEEIAALQALERPDLPGLALQLGSLAQALPKLPLAIERRFQPVPTAAAASGVGTDEGAGWNVLREMWRDLLGLVRIRTDTEYEKPLLAPEQSYFLRQNLRLMLYGAQLALLEGNADMYGQSLRAAQDWIEEYFDIEAPAVAGARAELARLLERKLTVELPDIASSLKALRAAARPSTQAPPTRTP